jgi:hypothetical protein
LSDASWLELGGAEFNALTEKYDKGIVTKYYSKNGDETAE